MTSVSFTIEDRSLVPVGAQELYGEMLEAILKLPVDKAVFLPLPDIKSATGAGGKTAAVRAAAERRGLHRYDIKTKWDPQRLGLWFWYEPEKASPPAPLAHRSPELSRAHHHEADALPANGARAQ